MKIKSDFITNSSSSSFIIAIENLPNTDKDSFLVLIYDKIIDSISNRVISDKESVENFIKEQKEDGYETSDLYPKMMKAVSEGYRVVFLEIDWNDEKLIEFIKSICDGKHIVWIGTGY